ncbi:MAG: metallophosphoesterase [Clostridia bacterium]|nr:metallophosphoesterase [Clostridia bacterium]
MPENIKKKPPVKKRRPPKKRTFWNKVWNLIKRLNNFTTAAHEDNVQREYHLFGRKVTFVGFMALIFIALFLIVLAMNDRSVSTDHESIIITGLPKEFEGYKILHISDLQGKNFGQDQSALNRIIGNLSYDAVVITGDMVGESGDPTAFYALLDVLNSRKPVYFIAGDNDPSPLLDQARDNASQTLTLNQMVLSDWVLGAQERGAILLNSPQKITKGSSNIWLLPDTFLNLDIAHAVELLKEEMEQEKESMLIGIEESMQALPFTSYRYQSMLKAEENLLTYNAHDIIIMLSHEIPTDSQIYVSQDSLTQEELKSYYPAPDLILSGHFCGGEWRVPGIGAFHIPSNMSARYGWFPNQDYVSGERSVGGTVVYTSPGLSVSDDTLLPFRLMNPPKITLITLTGELPASFLD